MRRAWPSRRSSRRREGLFGSSIIIEASERNGGWASFQLEELEQRKVLAVDVDLTGNVLTVAFDDAADDAITLSINSTGFFTSGANTTAGTGTITQLVVTDAGTGKTSSLTLAGAAQNLTGGLSIGPNIAQATITAPVATAGGNVSVDASQFTLSANIASGSGDQAYGPTIELGRSVTLSGNAASFAGGVNGSNFGLTVGFTSVTAINGSFTNLGDLDVTGPAARNGSIETAAGSATQCARNFDGVPVGLNGTGLGDGSNIVSTNTAVTSVQNGADFTALRLTQEGHLDTAANWFLPDLNPGAAIDGFNAAFDSMIYNAGGTPAADA